MEYDDIVCGVLERYKHLNGTDLFNQIKLIAGIAAVAIDVASSERMELKVKRNKHAKKFPLLHIKKDGDVGLDIPCTLDEDVVINPGCRYLVPTGIRIEIPQGYWASIEARSSTSQMMLVVPKGVIDEGYRGELFAQLLNVGREAVGIHDGDRLVQLILHKRNIMDFDITEVDKLSDSERGESGFGSTGK